MCICGQRRPASRPRDLYPADRCPHDRCCGADCAGFCLPAPAFRADSPRGPPLPAGARPGRPALLLRRLARLAARRVLERSGKHVGEIPWAMSIPVAAAASLDHGYDHGGASCDDPARARLRDLRLHTQRRCGDGYSASPAGNCLPRTTTPTRTAAERTPQRLCPMARSWSTHPNCYITTGRSYSPNSEWNVKRLVPM